MAASLRYSPLMIQVASLTSRPQFASPFILCKGPNTAVRTVTRQRHFRGGSSSLHGGLPRQGQQPSAVPRSWGCQRSCARGMVQLADKPSSLEELEEERRANFMDTYIPLTRRTLVHKLLARKNFLNEVEQRDFERLVLVLDVLLSSRLEGDLRSMKELYDSINPDRDVVDVHKHTRRERLDNEFYLLQRLSTVLERANFHELPSIAVSDSINERKRGGVLVSALPDQYAVVRMWALGRSSRRWPPGPVGQTSPIRQNFYRRVIVAVRQKSEDRLTLKAFKEVPCDRLELLLPSGTIRMSKLDQTLLLGYASTGLGGLLAKLMSDFLSAGALWPLPLVGGCALGAAYVWTGYKNKQQEQLVELSRTLYFKNIVNNRGLVSLIASKARDEMLKEVLTTYSFLLTSRSPSAHTQPTNQQPLPGALNISQLEVAVSDWIHTLTSQQISFDSRRALRTLNSLGVLNRLDDGELRVLPLDSALRLLEGAVVEGGGALVRGQGGWEMGETDLVEGFEVERSVMDQHEEDYGLVDKVRRSMGWK